MVIFLWEGRGGGVDPIQDLEGLFTSALHFGRAPWNGRPRRPTAIPPPAQTPRPTLPRSYGRSGRRESFIFPASPFTWPRRPGTLGQSLHPSPEEGRGGSGGFRGAGGQAGSGEASKRQREPRSTPAASAAAKLPPLPRLSGQAGGREGRLPAPAPVAPAAQPFGGPARELVWPPPAAQLAGGRDPAGRCPLSRAPRNRRPRPQLPRLRGRGAPRWEGGCFGAGRRTCAAGGAGPAWGGRRESLPGRHGNGAAISNPPGGASGAVPGCEGMAGQPQSAAAWDLTMRPFCSAGPAGKRPG